MISLFTGGKGRTKRDAIWGVTGSASEVRQVGTVGVRNDPVYALFPIPSQQVAMGDLGALSNGVVYKTLPYNVTKDVTPTVDGIDRYVFPFPGGPYHYVLTSAVRCLALTDTNRDRTTLGVGEYVDLSGMPGETTWETTAGSVWPTNGAGTTLNAPSNAMSGTVTAYVRKEKATLDFGTKAPTGYDSTYTVPTDPDCFTPGTIGAGMGIHVVIAPADVSFNQVNIWEVGQDASGQQGWYLSNPAPPHIGNLADQKISLGCDNSWPDHASGSGSWLDWSLGDPGGSFTWTIPVDWQVRNGPKTRIDGWSQTYTVGADGTVTVSKFGHTATRSRNQTCSTLQ